MRVVAVHLLNDYSGSPKVLMQLLKGWIKNDVETHLFTCGKRAGFLSDIPKVNNHFYWYRFKKNQISRLLFLSTSQFLLAFRLFFYLQKEDVLYINTVLPFGAGIIGKIKGCRVIYHIHETSVKPKILKWFLFGVVRFCANEVIYVSRFLSQQEPLKIRKNILHNVLEQQFLDHVHGCLKKEKLGKMVLMICSLKTYKGVNEFVALAQLNSNYGFKLVLNACQGEIAIFFKGKTLPPNLFVYPTQKETHRFYQEASVLLNLSHTDYWVETFGLTVLEGMAYGLPAIVPPIGGVVELVEEGKNGFLIDSKNVELISKRLDELFENPELYQQMSRTAKEKSALFCVDHFERESMSILSNRQLIFQNMENTGSIQQCKPCKMRVF